MKLTSGVKRRIRQESALKRRVLDVEFYSKMSNPDKIVQRKLKIAKNEVQILQQKLGL